MQWKPDGQEQILSKLRDEPYTQLFRCKVEEIMCDNNHALWHLLRLKACDEICGYEKQEMQCKHVVVE